MDQAPYAREIVSTVLGNTKLKSGTKHSIPLPAGTEFEGSLVTETPFDIKALSAAELKYGFKFHSCVASCILDFGRCIRVSDHNLLRMWTTNKG
jgi:hypothetical protein